MTRTWRPILPSEFHRIRMAGTAGFSFGEIGREFGRRTGTIARLFAPVRERRILRRDILRAAVEAGH